MDFTSMIKDGLGEKYSSMLSGKTKKQGVEVSVERTKEFLSKCEIVSRQAMNQKTVAELKEEAEKRREKIANVFQILAYISPIILSVIFGIVLFSNNQEINILYNFTGWCIAWVAFAIVSVATTGWLIYKRKEDWWDDKPRKVSAIVVAIIVGVFAIIGIVVSSQIPQDFDPTTFIALRAISKNTTTSGYNGYDINSEIVFKMKNVGPVKVTYVYGEMTFYNGATELECKDFSVRGDFEAGQQYNITLNITDRSSSIHNTSYENLGITFKITSLMFKDGIQYDFDGDVFVVKEIGHGDAQENNYQDALNLFNQGKYEEAMALFESLHYYRDSASYAQECEQKILEAEVERMLHNRAGENAILPDNYSVTSYTENSDFNYEGHYYTAFYCSLEVLGEEVETYLENFRSKLFSHGFSEVDSNTYQKRQTIIHFSANGQVDGCVEYHAWETDQYSW